MAISERKINIWILHLVKMNPSVNFSSGSEATKSNNTQPSSQNPATNKSLTDKNPDETMKQQEKIQYVMKTKLIPRYIGNDPKNPECLHPEIIQKHILRGVNITSDGNELLKVKTETLPFGHPEHHYSVKLIVRGKLDDVKLVLDKLERIMNEIIAYHNASDLLKDPQSIEIDVRISKTDSIGAKVVDTSKPNRYVPANEGYNLKSGLWIMSLKSGGELESALGNSINSGACIVRIADKEVNKLDDIITFWKEKQEGDVVPVRICLARNADLRFIDSNRVIPASNGDKNNLQRRNGAPYFGKYYIDNGSKKWIVRDISNIKKNKTKRLHTASTSLQPASKLNTSKAQSDGKHGQMKTKTSTNYSSYSHFIKKMRPIFDIEFKGRGVNGQSFNNSMWSNHKQIYGTNCDENCKCSLDLARLSSNVVSDFVLKNPSKFSSSTPEVGFIKFFVKKFMYTVRKDFPNDSPTGILEKLVTMWSKHREERRFGITCGAQCECADGLDSFLNALKKKNLKRKANIDPRLIMKRKPTSSSDQKTSLLKSVESSTQAMAYGLTFDPYKPLGFFAVTEKNKNKNGNVCTIVSISPVGRKKYPQLQIGTCITASSLNVSAVTINQRSSISGHKELRQRYEAARLKPSNPKLKLWFVKTKSSINSDSKDDTRNWTSTGAWKGEIESGWAGGASIAKNSTILSKDQKTNKKEYGHQSQGVLKKAKTKENKPSSNIFKADEPVAVAVAARRKSLLKSVTPVGRGGIASLLRKSSSFGGNKTSKNRKSNVTFAENLEHVKFFSPNHTTLGTTQHTSTNTKKINVVSKKNLGDDALSDASIRHDYKKVLQLLKKGHDPQRRDSLNKFPLDYITENIAKLKDELHRANVSSKEMMKVQDRAKKNETLLSLNLKKKLLKIFIEIDKGVEVAQYMHDWVKLEVLVDSVSNIQLTPHGSKKANLFPKFAYCALQLDDAKLLPELPPLAFNSYLDWSDRPYYCIYNPNVDFTFRNKELKIKFGRGVISTTGQDRNLQLGTVTHSFEDIKNEIEENGGTEITKSFSRTEDLMGGSICVRIKKSAMLPEDFEKERIRLISQIDMLTQWINLFRDEASRGKEVKDDNELDINIAVPISGGMTLLHAACFTGDPNLVRKLLHLGADPSASSAYGLPIDIAKRFHDDNFKEIVHILKNNLVKSDLRENNSIAKDKGTQEPENNLDKSIVRSDNLRQKNESQKRNHNNIASGKQEVKNKRKRLGNEETQEMRDLENRQDHPKHKIEKQKQTFDFSHTDPDQDKTGISQKVGPDRNSIVDNISASSRSFHLQDPRAQNKLVSEVQSILDEISVNQITEKAGVTVNRSMKHIAQPNISLSGRKERKTEINEKDPRFKNSFKSHIATQNGKQSKSLGNKSNAQLKSDPRNILSQDPRLITNSIGSINEEKVAITAPKMHPPLPPEPPPMPIRINESQHNFGGNNSYDNRNINYQAVRNTNQWQVQEEWDSEVTIDPPPVPPPPPPPPPPLPPGPIPTLSHGFIKVQQNIYSSKERNSESTKKGNPKMDPRLLPRLTKIEWMEGNAKRCHQFNLSRGCRDGVACKFMHVQDPIGIILDESNFEPSELTHFVKDLYISVKIEKAPNGKQWYTAAYRRPRDNIIYYAERGKNAQISSQGIYWYASEKDAKLAVKKVVFVAEQKRSGSYSNQNAKLDSNMQKRLPQKSQNEPFHKRYRYDEGGNTTFNNQRQQQSYFGQELKKLMEVPNLQLVYNKIFPRTQLKKKYWSKEIKRVGGFDLFTVVFECPDQNGTEYRPAENTGVLLEGKWWYKDEKTAKAVTFLWFFMRLSEMRIIKDIRHTHDGRELF